MTVVRTLTTNLDFNVDFTAINQFTKSIKDFKINFLIGSVAAVDFARRVVGAITEVSTLIRDTKELSATTGIAFESLYKLAEAAQKVGLDKNGFGNLLVDLQKQILDAAHAMGPLYDFIRDNESANFSVLDNMGNPRPVLEVLQDIINSLNQIENQQQRIDFIGKLFKGNSAARLDSFFNGIGRNINAIITSDNYSADQLAKSKNFGDKFLNSISQLVIELQNILEKLTIFFGPLILSLVNVLTLLLASINKIFEILHSITSKLSETAKSVLNNELVKSGLSNVGRSFLNDMDVSDIYGTNSHYGLPVTIQNNVDINVPEGTSTEQAKVISEAASESFNSNILYYLRQLIINNPQVE